MMCMYIKLNRIIYYSDVSMCSGFALHPYNADHELKCTSNATANVLCLATTRRLPPRVRTRDNPVQRNINYYVNPSRVIP